MRQVINTLYIAIAAGFLMSCEQEVVVPDFDVSAVVEKTSVIAEDGETVLDAYNVKFTFTGAPDNIVFYSGENGSDYRNRDRDTRVVTPYMNFTSTYTGSTPSTLRVLVSNDFVPEYEYLAGTPTEALYTTWGVRNATWTDITDRFNIPGNKLTVGPQESGEAILSEFNVNTPVFVAFQFKAQTQDMTSPGVWSFSGFNIRNVLLDGTSESYVVDGISNLWKSVDLADPIQCSRGVGKASLTASDASDIDTYLISTPFYPSNVTPDTGLAIKSIDQNLYEYTHTYVSPEKESVYVAFIATNSLYGKVSTVIREFELKFE